MKSLTAIIIVSAKDHIRAKTKRAEKSVRFADEVLVIRKEKPITDFAAVRNEALKKAKGKWVLFVDADEKVTQKLAKEICQILPTSEVAFRLRRKDKFLGKWLNHGETASVRLVRLARNDVGEWRRPVHEVWEINEEVGEMRNPLLHYSHESLDEMLEKIDRYSTLEARYRNKQIDPSTSFRASRYTNTLIYKFIIILQMLVFSGAKFLHNYVFRLGFLDGVAGFVQALMMSFHSFLVRAKQLENRDQ